MCRNMYSTSSAAEEAKKPLLPKIYSPLLEDAPIYLWMNSALLRKGTCLRYSKKKSVVSSKSQLYAAGSDKKTHRTYTYLPTKGLKKTEALGILTATVTATVYVKSERRKKRTNTEHK